LNNIFNQCQIFHPEVTCQRRDHLSPLMAKQMIDQHAEIVASEADAARFDLARAAELCGAALSLRPSVKADLKAAARRAREMFEVATLDAFGDFTTAELAAIGLVLDYVQLTQAGAAPRLAPPKRSAERAFLAIDPATRAALEIDRSNTL
jgi:DNA mismatch repair protein MutS